MSVFSSLLSPDENKNRGKNEKLLFKCLGLGRKCLRMVRSTRVLGVSMITKLLKRL